METIINFILSHGVEIIATGVIAGVTFAAGHIRGYIKRKAEEPQQDIYDIVQAVIEDIEKRKEKDAE